MRRKYIWLSCLISMIFCFSSIAHADGKYYTFVGTVSYIDDPHNIVLGKIWVGMPINYSFFVDYNRQGELFRNDGLQSEIHQGKSVENFYCDYYSGSALNSIDGGYCNDADNDFAEYNYGLNVTNQETGLHTGYLYGKSLNDKVSIDSYRLWIKELTSGTSVISKNQVYNSIGQRAIVYGRLTLDSIKITPPTTDAIIDRKSRSSFN
jgi:hypothetical protein